MNTRSSMLFGIPLSVLRAGIPLWQKSFHDHVIRGEADYRRIWSYIDANPRKWREDCYYV